MGIFNGKMMDAARARRTLGVSLAQFNLLVKQGALTQVLSGKDAVFPVSEVEELGVKLQWPRIGTKERDWCDEFEVAARSFKLCVKSGFFTLHRVGERSLMSARVDPAHYEQMKLWMKRAMANRSLAKKRRKRTQRRAG